MRHALLLIGWVVIAGSVQAGDVAKQQTIDYVKKLQTPNGSFTATAAQANVPVVPTLRATTAAVRSLHYLGSVVPNESACKKFIDSCFHPGSGGFSDKPNGKPDVVATAVGLMAVTELKMPTEKYAAAATKYLSVHTKGFDDIRIAVAGLERLDAKSPRTEEWISEVLALQNKDGTYGKGAGVARDTGSCVVTLLRLGAKVPTPDTYVKLLNDGQRQNGGWGKADDEIASDLETTYRVMRCFMMLKSQPKYAEGVRSFLAKCRNADGGYGVAPGQPSNVNATYYAAIIKLWMKD